VSFYVLSFNVVSICYFPSSVVPILITWGIVCHFSLSLRGPIPSLALQAGLVRSLEKSFALPIYADSMARASLKGGPTCAPRPGLAVDPRVLKYVDIDAAVDNTSPSDFSGSGSSCRSDDIWGDGGGDSMSS